MAQDANEHIPAKLRAEEAAAEAEFLKGTGEPAPDGAAAVVDDPMPPAPEAEPPTTDGSEPPAPTADATPAPDAGDTPKTTPDSDEQKPTGTLEQQLAEAQARAERAENQYKTLMGKYNAEPPRLQREIVDLKRVVADLETRLTAAQAGTPPADDKADPPTQALDPANPYGLTDEQREFGDDIINVAEKIAKKLVEDQIGDVRVKAESATAELQRRSQGEFVAKLDEAAPDWRTINVDPAFAAFCDEAEPNSGMTWQQIIDLGKGSMDASRIAGVFNTFRSRQGGTKPAKTTSPAATTTVESQVAPSAAPSPSPTEKRIYSLKEYNTLMDNVAAGKYGLGSERAEKIEAELDKAWSEGRIKG